MNRKYFVVRQAFTSFQHGFLRSAENVDLHNLIGVIWENIFLHNITNVVYVFYDFGLYNGIVMTIVVLGRYACFYGRCYCQYF